MSETLLDKLASNLAENLRSLRERRGLTQARLGKLSDIPRSTLANLETGSGNPTLAVLGRLAAAMQISIEELLSAPAGLGRIYPAGSLPSEQRGPNRGVRISRLLPDPIPGMEITRMELDPTNRFKGAPHRPGTKEYLYCERGSVVLRVAGETFHLLQGDLCSFRGDEKHSYTNEGDQLAVAMGVVVVASV